jgi:6-phosphofructokinase 1
MRQQAEIVPVKLLGPAQFTSPLDLSTVEGDGVGNFVSEDSCVRHRIEIRADIADENDLLFEKAGPREKLFFDPTDTRVAMVTCGGLCPGLNNVIRSAFLELHYNYGVSDVFGYRYGYKGLNPAHELAPLRLTSELVERIDKQGGTILGTSRGQEPLDIMADTLERERINVLLCVGGDGTQRGAHRLHEELDRRGAKIAVVGIPKTVDNDIHYCSVTFGYETAINAAREVLQFAHNEAKSALNGIALVKVMGRDAGFIAAGAALASQEVNFALVPEVPFKLEGTGGFLNALRERILARRHAVIVAAEGAGQDLFEDQRSERDASGNVRYNDIGLHLKDAINRHFCEQRISIDLKYIDPSYILRSAPANCFDGLLCNQLARRAVHAAMAGRTDVMIGYWNCAFMHVPIPMATETKKQLDPEGELWTSVLAATGQARCYAN